MAGYVSKRLSEKKFRAVFHNEDAQPKWNQFFTLEQVASLAGYEVPREAGRRLSFLQKVGFHLNQLRKMEDIVLVVKRAGTESVTEFRLRAFIYSETDGLYTYGFTNNLSLALDYEMKTAKTELSRLESKRVTERKYRKRKDRKKARSACIEKIGQLSILREHSSSEELKVEIVTP